MRVMMELRHAARALGRRPGFTAMTVLTLGLGIAATTTMFSVVYRLLIAPLPFANADRLVYVWRSSDRMAMAPPHDLVQAWVRGSNALEWLSEFERRTFVVRHGDELARTVAGGALSTGLLEQLDVKPLIGRSFTPADTVAGAAPVVLLGESLWRERFGGSTDAVGQVLRIDGRLRTIIGVVPDRLAAHHGDDRSAVLWVPIEPTAPDVLPMYDVIARLKPGVTAADAQAELETIARATPLLIPLPGEWGTQVAHPGDQRDDSTKRTVLILFSAVVLVLLIACGNVSGLLLARSADRRQELAVRAALGARGVRLAAPLIGEGVLLAAAAVITGLLLANWGVDIIRAWRPQNLLFLDAVGLQPAVVGFAVVMAALAASVSAALGVLQAPTLELMNAIRPSASGVRGGSRIRHAVVAAEISLSTVLVIAALLLIRTVTALQARDPGFDPDRVLSARIVVPDSPQPDAAQPAFASGLMERIRSLPGVEAATVASEMPTRTQLVFGSLEIEGAETALPAGPIPLATADEMYMRTLGIPLREGRFFTLPEPQPDPVVVSESFARTHFPGTTAVGRRIRLTARGQWLTIIGVVGDVSVGAGTVQAGGSQLYLPFTQSVMPRMALLVRTAPGIDPLGIVSGLRATVHELDPELPLRDVATLRRVLNDRTARERFAASLLSVFALLAVALAVTGLFALMSYAVTRRTREIGIRVALGASPGIVHAMLLAEGVRLTVIGLVAGVLAALWAVRFTESLLHGMPPHNLTTFVLAIAAMAAASIAAVWLPTRRATRIDPQAALRAE